MMWSIVKLPLILHVITDTSLNCHLGSKALLDARSSWTYLSVRLLLARLTDSDSRSLQISKLKQQLQLQRSKAAVSGGADGARQRDQSQGSCSLGATQVTWHLRRTQTNGLSMCLCALFCSWCDKHNRLLHWSWTACSFLSFDTWSCSTLQEVNEIKHQSKRKTTTSHCFCF